TALHSIRSTLSVGPLLSAHPSPPTRPAFPAPPASLLTVLPTDSASDTDDETLRHDSHQRRDGRVDSAGHDDRFAGHYRVISMPGDIGRRQPHESWQLLHSRASACHVVKFAVGKPGTDSGDEHAVAPDFVTERFRELDEKRLCRRIQRMTGGRWHQAGERRDVDDAAIAPLDHP